MRFAAIAVLLLCLGICTEKRTSTPQPTIAAVAKLPVLPRLSALEATALIHVAAKKHNVPAAFVKSIMAAESNFYPGAISQKGAIGLMQLMPETAQQFGVDPTIPAQNVDGGAGYLKVLLARYRKSKNCLRRAIAAYNAGPGVVDRYRGVPPYRETRAYVARVLGYLRRFQKEG